MNFRKLLIAASISFLAIGVATSNPADAAPKKAQTISFNQPKSMAPGMEAQDLIATASSRLKIGFSTKSPASICSVKDGKVTPKGLGKCTVVATQTGNSKFLPQSASKTFLIKKLAQTIAFVQPAALAPGSPAQPVIASASSGLDVQISTNSPKSICNVEDGKLFINGKGVCVITASQSGDKTYKEAKRITISINVGNTTKPATGQPQLISFTPPAELSLSQQTATLYATASSGLPVYFLSNSPAVCRVAGSILTVVSFGSCNVTAVQVGDLTFVPADPVTASINVTKRKQVINWSVPSNLSVSQSGFIINATASSGLPVSMISTSPEVCRLSGSVLTLVTSGICYVHAYQDGNGLYLEAPQLAAEIQVTAPTLVKKIKQSISFTLPATKLMSEGPGLELEATATSGLNVFFSSATPEICGVASNSLTIRTAGKCTVMAAQPGNETYDAATPIFASMQLNKDPQTLWFSTKPESISQAQSPFPIAVFTTSRLPATVTSLTPNVCLASPTSLTWVATGTCTLLAEQPGNEVFAAAPGVRVNIASVAVIGYPLNLTGPVITGEYLVGKTLTATKGTWTGVTNLSTETRWYRCIPPENPLNAPRCIDAPIATGETMVIPSIAINNYIYAEVFAWSDYAKKSKASSSRTPLIYSAPIWIDNYSNASATFAGFPVATSISGVIASPAATYSYQWYRCESRSDYAVSTKPADCVEISGATNLEYTATIDDVRKYARLRVTATNSQGSSVTYTSAAFAIGVKISNKTAPTILGVAKVGNRLTVNNGEWFGTPSPVHHHRWWACPVSVTASSSTSCLWLDKFTDYLDVTESMVGKYLIVQVLASNQVENGIWFSGDRVDFFTASTEQVTN